MLIHAEGIIFARHNAFDRHTVSSIIATLPIANAVTFAGIFISPTPGQAYAFNIAIIVVITVTIDVTRGTHTGSGRWVAQLFFRTAIQTGRTLRTTALIAPPCFGVAVTSGLPIAICLTRAFVVPLAPQSAGIGVTKAAAKVYTGFNF